MKMQVKFSGIGETQRRVASLQNLGPKAIAVGLNRTADEINAGVRRQMQSRFNIRESRFLPPVQLPREDRADESRNKLTAEVTFYSGATAAPRGRSSGGNDLAIRRGAILSKFERGGTKTSSLGQVAIPTRRTRPTASTVIAKQLFPVNLRLVVSRLDPGANRLKAVNTRKLGQSKRLTAQGLNGKVFFAGVRRGTFGIYERQPGRSGPRLVWAFRDRVRIPALLGFYRVAEQVRSRRLRSNLDEALKFYLRVQAARA